MMGPAGEKGGAAITVLYEQARNWVIGSDPGLLRLRMATRTTAALGCSLLALYVLTRATGQPLTVALLGVVITMVASRSVNEPDPRQQRITMALLPVPAAVSITAAAVLASHQVVSDAVFVVVVFGAAYIRRFGARGRALGMVAFMSYFFTLYLRARISELPWMIGAVAVGTVCTFVMTAYVMPDRPERVLRATIRALRARMAIVVDTAAEAVRTGRLDERRRRRMRARTLRLNETALMVQSQIEDKADPALLWPGVTAEQLAPWLLDAELAIEWVATAGRRAAALVSEAPSAIPTQTRVALVDALSRLARASRGPTPGDSSPRCTRSVRSSAPSSPRPPTSAGAKPRRRTAEPRADGGSEAGQAGGKVTGLIGRLRLPQEVDQLKHRLPQLQLHPGPLRRREVLHVVGHRRGLLLQLGQPLLSLRRSEVVPAVVQFSHLPLQVCDLGFGIGGRRRLELVNVAERGSRRQVGLRGASRHQHADREAGDRHRCDSHGLE